MTMTGQRSVLITGCSSGIGRHVVGGLQQRGYRVFATARRQEDVTELGKLGFEALQLDLANSASIRQCLAAVMAQTGGVLYALFNNGAFGQAGAVEDLSRDALREQFEANLFGMHELTTLVIPVMRRQGYGRIIQNSSLLGYVALKYRGAYNASKFALEGLSDTLRLELAGSGVYVSLIEPGPIRSKFRRNAWSAFRRHVDSARSHHGGVYTALAERLQAEDPVAPFTLGPDAVLQPVIHALESHRPRARYRVTFPAHLFAWLKRVLPDRALDWILGKI